MKRLAFVAMLVLAIASSVTAGTLSSYTIAIDNLAHGSVTAKEFVLEPGQTNTISENVEIAPGETVEWKFSVQNHDGTVVSETAMDLDFTIDIDAAYGKSAIEPLKISITDENDNTLTKLGTGTIKFFDEFKLSESKQEKIYTILIEWPLGVTDSIYYVGAEHGTSIKVSVTGIQK